MDNVIGTGKLLELTGLTERKLNYWIQRDVIHPVNGDNPGSGNRRMWALGDVPRIKFINDARDVLGEFVSSDLIKKIYDNYDHGSVYIGNGVFISWDPGEE